MSAAFTPEQQLPDILRSHPQTRAVFDRYGLKGCGGHHGPAESIGFFARAHGVDESRLIKELAEAVSKPARAAAAQTGSFADYAYKPFFMAGIAVLFIAGAVGGTLMLAWMSADASPFAPGLRRMNGHANAMIYGFAGMFIMGFAYQALPRFRHTTLWKPPLAAFSFVMLLGGVLLRGGGEYFGQQGLYQPGLAPWAFYAGIAGTVLELNAFALLAIVMWKTLRVDGRLRVYERFVFASVFWFMASLVYSLWVFIRIDRAADFAEMIATVAIWQEPLRVMQLYGAIGLVVVGVMLRFLPAVFGFRDPGERLFARMFWVVNGGVLLAVVSWPLAMAAKRGLLDLPPGLPRGAWLVGALLIAAGMLIPTAGFAAWRRPRVADRSVKFARAALAWLAISLLMMLAEPLYIVLLGGFGHGYHAGGRHAFTIGFMTMMIIAVSAKVVPTLNGVDPARLGRLWPVFALLNVSLLWRVGGEIAGDFDPALLAGLHWSGVLASAALLLWAAHIVRVIVNPPVAAPERATDITPETKVAAVVETWPQTMPVFVRHGFTLLTNPVARRTVARGVSLDHVCRMHHHDVHKFVHELRVAAGLARPEPVAPRWTVNPDTPVVEAARTHPALAAVFARLGMDACCGGAESIEKSAEHNGLALDAVMHELEMALEEVHHDTAGKTGA